MCFYLKYLVFHYFHTYLCGISYCLYIVQQSVYYSTFVGNLATVSPLIGHKPVQGVCQNFGGNIFVDRNINFTLSHTRISICH